MRLATAIVLSEKRLSAGGPGSGRHPEGNGNGSGAQVKKMQEHLEKAGFKHEGKGIYSHPDKGKVSVYDSGAFHHVANYDSTKSSGVNNLGGRPGNGLEMLRRRISAATAKCPHCGSKKHALMPTDFEMAKCEDCGKTFEINAGNKDSVLKEHKRLVRRLREGDPSKLKDEARIQYKELQQLKKGKKVAAGGPGSGRHPEGGSGKIKDAPPFGMSNTYTHKTSGGKWNYDNKTGMYKSSSGAVASPGELKQYLRHYVVGV